MLHTDQAARDSLALDVLEAIRPDIDRWVLETVETHTFRKVDFYETRRGVFRVGADLARAMAETLPTWRRLLAPIVEEVAVAIASSSERPLRVATKLTETRRIQGRGRRSSSLLRLAACRECGVVLADAERQICDDCLPDYDRERTEKLSTVGKATLAAMRASSDDPARSPEATAKRQEKSRSTSLAMRGWEREHARAIRKRTSWRSCPASRR